jgi:hypothetical protein
MFGFNTQRTQSRIRYKGERLNLRQRRKREEGRKGKNRSEDSGFSQGWSGLFTLQVTIPVKCLKILDLKFILNLEALNRGLGWLRN